MRKQKSDIEIYRTKPGLSHTRLLSILRWDNIREISSLVYRVRMYTRDSGGESIIAITDEEDSKRSRDSPHLLLRYYRGNLSRECTYVGTQGRVSVSSYYLYTLHALAEGVTQSTGMCECRATGRRSEKLYGVQSRSDLLLCEAGPPII